MDTFTSLYGLSASQVLSFSNMGFYYIIEALESYATKEVKGKITNHAKDKFLGFILLANTTTNVPPNADAGTDVGQAYYAFFSAINRST